MGLSAKRLGQCYGLTAEEMNVLLKEEGFLSGKPRDYVPTEKGKRYIAAEKYKSNGYGGYAARGWEWLEWDESIKNELDISSERINEIRQHTSEQRRRRRAEANEESAKYWEQVRSRKTQQDTRRTSKCSKENTFIGVSSLFAWIGHRKEN